MHAISEGYTVVMALQDYMPVILSSIGLFLLARMVTRMHAASGRMAMLGWILITAGGLCKASWKLIMASSSSTINLTFLDDALFVLLGPGFTFLAFAIAYGQRSLAGKPPVRNVWVLPAIISVIALATAIFMGISRPDSRLWFFILLGLTTIMNFAAGILVIRQGLKQGNVLVALLFGVNLVAILMLTGMARIDPQTIPLEWTEQITNTLSNLAFAFAAWQLSQRTISQLNIAAPQGAAA